MIFSNDLVTKSMRLPPDIVEYIDEDEIEDVDDLDDFEYE